MPLNNNQNLAGNKLSLVDTKLKKITNYVIFFVMLCMLFAFFYGYILLQNTTYVIILYFLPPFVYGLYLTKLNKTLTAITILFFGTSLLITVFSIIQGEETATHYHFINTIISLSLLFGYENAKKNFYLSVAFTALNIVFVLLCFKYHWFETYKSKHDDTEGIRLLNFLMLVPASVVFSFAVVRNSKIQQKQLRYSLEEQKTLLAEVNHRVKNNMAIIISLLNLKRDMSSSSETHEALNDCKNRVMSMAIVHQKMYQSKSKSDIELDDYISELTDEIKNSLNFKKAIIVIKQVDKIKLNISVAIPIGLILNELITNSIKHAFDNTEKPEIKIKVELNNKTIKLEYSDNGKGVENINEIKSETLGLILIDSLSGQIDGKYEFKNSNGLKFQLQFPIT